jgi:hypothetical protein
LYFWGADRYGKHLWNYSRQTPSVQTPQYSLIHRDVANAIHGLVDFLNVERRRVPDTVIQEANRLESIVFSGYDPYFAGDEPPDL